MIFLWTKSNLVGSRMIRWGLDEPCSHFAVCFFEDRGATALVLESTLEHGAAPCWLGDFLARNDIVHALQVPSESKKAEADLMHSIGSRMQGRKYDKDGVLFWSAMALRRKMFGTKMPTVNEWSRSELLYCVEILQEMPELLADLDIQVPLDMTSPEMVYNILKECELLLDVTEYFKNVDSALENRRTTSIAA